MGFPLRSVCGACNKLQSLPLLQVMKVFTWLSIFLLAKNIPFIPATQEKLTWLKNRSSPCRFCACPFFSVKSTRALMALSVWSVSGPQLPMYIKGKLGCWGKDKAITGVKMTNGKEILCFRIIMGTWQDVSSIICKVTTSQLCRHPSP